jgi:hypothetical protein
MLAGPGTLLPGAQCLGELRARLSLFAGLDPAAALASELGLRAVEAGPAADALWPEDRSLLAIAPRELVLSALAPAATGDGAILIRVLNPTPAPLDAELSLGLPFARARFVQLDESPADGAPAIAGSTLRFRVGAHALRTVLLER